MYLEDQRDVLGKTDPGIRPAIRHASRENHLAGEIAS